MLEELMEHANGCTNLFAFRLSMLERLGKTIPFDSAIYVQGPGDPPASINKDRFLQLHPKVLRESRFRRDLLKMRGAVAAERVVIDTHTFSLAERSRSPFFNDVMRPQGVRSQLVASVD